VFKTITRSSKEFQLIDNENTSTGTKDDRSQLKQLLLMLDVGSSQVPAINTERDSTSPTEKNKVR
jgi:glutaredoxin